MYYAQKSLTMTSWSLDLIWFVVLIIDWDSCSSHLLKLKWVIIWLFIDSFLVQHGHSSLMTACQEGHLEVVQHLVAQGADLYTQNNVSDKFMYLVDKGLDVNAKNNVSCRKHVELINWCDFMFCYHYVVLSHHVIFIYTGSMVWEPLCLRVKKVT